MVIIFKYNPVYDYQTKAKVGIGSCAEPNISNQNQKMRFHYVELP